MESDESPPINNTKLLEAVLDGMIRSKIVVLCDSIVKLQSRNFGRVTIFGLGHWSILLKVLLRPFDVKNFVSVSAACVWFTTGRAASPGI